MSSSFGLTFGLAISFRSPEAYASTRNSHRYYMSKCAKLKIFGKVQGVFFRDFTEEQANKLGVKGWVKNMPDGTVEALIEGKDELLEQMIIWCYEGSPNAIVKDVKVEWVKPEGCVGFEIKY